MTDPALWDALLEVKGETEAFGTTMLLGERRVLSEEDDLYLTTWLDGDAWVVAAVDTRTGGDDRLGDFTFALPAASDASLLRGDAGDLLRTQTGLRVRLGPGETAVLFAPAAVPEPSAAVMAGAGLLLLARRRRLRRPGREASGGTPE